MPTLIDSILHLDSTLNTLVSSYGVLTYLLLFAVIFCETGLVVTPFLPGDSLLFAAGSIAAQDASGLNALVLFILLTVASIVGNQLNFIIGSFLGPHIFSGEKTWFFNKKHLEKTQVFYEEHGGKTIIFARFIPIIRTFAPFVAGIGKMPVGTFLIYNLVSALLWISSLLSLGYFLGSLPLVKEHFSLVLYGIIVLSLIPPMIALVKKS